MQITLPPEAQAIIEREIESGRYATREDVIVDALRHLDDEQYAYDPLRDPKVLEAIEQADRGEAYELTEEVHTRIREEAALDFARGAEIHDDVKY
ncbi:MAG: type II toxin-antitoxin system ParD family antitoxin [Chloroflexota bacterium]|nr:type II toxin-antitoxin system ParD family antitoxin [Chloroflexota bacterium]